jgi:hypothetical protein
MAPFDVRGEGLDALTGTIIGIVLRTIALTALFFALSAPAALAAEGHDGGEGLWGETNDKVVTFAAFILIAGFPLLILMLTLIQTRLDKRKDRRLAAAKARRARADERGGW